jgi:hypothetical protein
MAGLTPSPCYISKWKDERMPTPQQPVSQKRLAANRANAAKSTGPRTPQGKARSAQNGRKHGFTASTFAVVRLEDLQEIAHLRADLIAVYQPVNSQELFAIERLALTQQALLRAARLESGLFTTCLNEALDRSGNPVIFMDSELSGNGDIEITRAQNRNYALGEGFHRINQQSNSWSLALRYQAQAERHYRRAVEEFERLKALRQELPGEPMLDPQPEPKEPLEPVTREPISPPSPAAGDAGPRLPELPGAEAPVPLVLQDGQSPKGVQIVDACRSRLVQRPFVDNSASFRAPAPLRQHPIDRVAARNAAGPLRQRRTAALPRAQWRRGRGPGCSRRWRGELAEWFQDFPVRPDELRTKAVNHEKVLKWYADRTGLDGRYRVLEVIDGAGPGLIRGRTIYRATVDFAHLHAARYQYSPYLFEALMQLAAFHMLAMDPRDRRSMLPVEIGEMRFLRQCRPGRADNPRGPPAGPGPGISRLGRPGTRRSRPHFDAGSWDAHALGFALTRFEKMVRVRFEATALT